MIKHTPGPWNFHHNGDGTFAVLAPNKNWVLAFLQNGEIMPEKQQTNAKRIVSCVNAMEGIAEPDKAVQLLREFACQINNNATISVSPNSTYGKMLKELFQTT